MAIKFFGFAIFCLIIERIITLICYIFKFFKERRKK